MGVNLQRSVAISLTHIINIAAGQHVEGFVYLTNYSYFQFYN